MATYACLCQKLWKYAGEYLWAVIPGLNLNDYGPDTPLEQLLSFTGWRHEGPVDIKRIVGPMLRTRILSIHVNGHDYLLNKARIYQNVRILGNHYRHFSRNVRILTATPATRFLNTQHSDKYVSIVETDRILKRNLEVVYMQTLLLPHNATPEDHDRCSFLSIWVQQSPPPLDSMATNGRRPNLFLEAGTDLLNSRRLITPHPNGIYDVSVFGTSITNGYSLSKAWRDLKLPEGSSLRVLRFYNIGTIEGVQY